MNMAAATRTRIALQAQATARTSRNALCVQRSEVGLQRPVDGRQHAHKELFCGDSQCRV